MAEETADGRVKIHALCDYHGHGLEYLAGKTYEVSADHCEWLCQNGIAEELISGVKKRTTTAPRTNPKPDAGA